MSDPIRAALERLLSDIQTLADNSQGIEGLHLNGDTAPWDELLVEGGCYSSWLGDAIAAARLALAVELLQQQQAEINRLRAQQTPVPVSEGLPKRNTKVLAHYFNALGNGRTICAVWVPAKSRSYDADFADDDFTEYDEEDDKYYWPEGWYEAIENSDDLGWVAVNCGEVAYWQPLPKWPALPMPQGEVE